MKKPSSQGKSLLARGTNLCKDIPVSEGEYGRPKELRDGQLAVTRRMCAESGEISAGDVSKGHILCFC